jgi:predicted lactoylglutathione lyase
MPQMVFINLPVTDIAQSRTFYESLGFSINPQFSDDETACVVVSDTIFFMIMTHGKFAGFSPRPIADTQAATSALIALTRDSREAVDAFGAAVVANGGSDNGKPQDLGFMYGQSYSDPDGHVLEVVWMDPSAVG